MNRFLSPTILWGFGSDQYLFRNNTEVVNKVAKSFSSLTLWDFGLQPAVLRRQFRGDEQVLTIRDRLIFFSVPWDFSLHNAFSETTSRQYTSLTDDISSAFSTVSRALSEDLPHEGYNLMVILHQFNDSYIDPRVLYLCILTWRCTT